MPYSTYIGNQTEIELRVLRQQQTIIRNQEREQVFAALRIVLVTQARSATPGRPFCGRAGNHHGSRQNAADHRSGSRRF